MLYIYFKLVAKLLVVSLMMIALMKGWSNRLRNQLVQVGYLYLPKNKWGMVNLEALLSIYDSDIAKELKNKISRFVRVERASYVFFAIGIIIALVFSVLFFMVLPSLFHSQNISGSPFTE
ncbi:MAG TPA: hypothetical protein VKT28_01530 [Puia sp.]|nr:hypothetical protein [Puia sp.]